MSVTRPQRPDPFCENCGYSLSGLTESSKCPECGKPLVEVLQRDLPAARGRRYQSQTRVFGLPLVSIALGPHHNERIGRAVGIFALGDVAFGWFSVGAILSVGWISIGGGLAVGLLALGGFGLGGLTLAGLSLGGIAIGGMAAGVFSSGGAAFGYAAQGGGAFGHFARGGEVRGTHIIAPGLAPDPQAVQFFDQWRWLLGGPPGEWLWMPLANFIAASLLLASALALLLLIASRSTRSV